MTAYDEIHDRHGAKRAAYVAIQTRTRMDVTRPSEQIVQILRRPGSFGRQGIYPVPLVLNEDEYRSIIVPAVMQRAYLLQALFEDLAIGGARLMDSEILQMDELDWILQSEGITLASLRKLWQGQVREQVRFIYAPDLVRDPAGRWVVLEDNVGCVGGIAQGSAIREAYLQVTGLPPDPACGCSNDLERAINMFLDRTSVDRTRGAVYGFAGMPPNRGCSTDLETLWKAECLRSLGITVLEPQELLDQIRNVEGISEISGVINLSSTLSPVYRSLAMVLFSTAKIPVFGAPCAGFIASKSFLPVDNQLAQLYLGEPLMIRSATSTLIQYHAYQLPQVGVLKRSNGCQGTEVFFLDEFCDDARRDLLATIREWGPCGAIVQDLVERSVLPSARPDVWETASLELRPIVYVYGWRSAFVGEVVNARAVTTKERRGNMSRGASCLPVLRQATAPDSAPSSSATLRL